jgi:signal transduction histidine kinase
MPSAAPEPIGGTVDSDGRLTAADPRLLQLQREAGSELGQPLAVPQLAFIVRLARKLGVTISRPALAASAEADLDLWVRAEPDGGGVRLTVESWVERPPQRSRWPEDRPPPGLEIAADYRFSLDADLRLLSLSPDLADQLGTEPKAAIGLPLTRLVQLEADEAGDMPLLGALAARSDFDGQRAVPKAGGAALILSGAVRLGTAGEFAGFAGRAAAERAHAPPAVVAPELKELLRLPLDRIVAEARQIADRAQGPLRSDYATYAGDIMTASRHLLDVLRSTTAAARRGGDEADERIDLVALALEAAGLVQAEATEARMKLEVEGETALAAHGDARAVTQILVNLIGNAVRHSPAGGTVRIIAGKGSGAEISIADQGPGVAPQDRERIFEAFEQAAPKVGGVGLGLAISRRLARSMGGDILLDPAPGPGARFTLRLPLA